MLLGEQWCILTALRWGTRQLFLLMYIHNRSNNTFLLKINLFLLMLLLNSPEGTTALLSLSQIHKCRRDCSIYFTVLGFYHLNSKQLVKTNLDRSETQLVPVTLIDLLRTSSSATNLLFLTCRQEVVTGNNFRQFVDLQFRFFQTVIIISTLLKLLQCVCDTKKSMFFKGVFDQ